LSTKEINEKTSVEMCSIKLMKDTRSGEIKRICHIVLDKDSLRDVKFSRQVLLNEIYKVSTMSPHFRIVDKKMVNKSGKFFGRSDKIKVFSRLYLSTEEHLYKVQFKKKDCKIIINSYMKGLDEEYKSSTSTVKIFNSDRLIDPDLISIDEVHEPLNFSIFHNHTNRRGSDYSGVNEFDFFSLFLTIDEAIAFPEMYPYLPRKINDNNFLYTQERFQVNNKFKLIHKDKKWLFTIPSSFTDSIVSKIKSDNNEEAVAEIKSLLDVIESYRLDFIKRNNLKEEFTMLDIFEKKYF